jgi:hypothetical protein
MAIMTTHELQNISGIYSNITSMELRSNEAELQPGNDDSLNFKIKMESLPPTDYKRQAYLVLAGCILI